MFFSTLMMGLSIALRQQEKRAEPASPLIDNDVAVHCLSVTPSWNRIAIAGGTQKGGDWKILDLRDGKCVINGLTGQQRCGAAHALSLSPNSWLIAMGGDRNKLYL